jgi:hypothetical protein
MVLMVMSLSMGSDLSDNRGTMNDLSMLLTSLQSLYVATSASNQIDILTPSMIPLAH